MKSGLIRASIMGMVPCVLAACFSSAPRGELSDTPWKDIEKMPFSEWRVISEKPRLLQRERASTSKVDDKKDWADGHVSQIELRNEDTRTIKFDLEATAAAGPQRCEGSVVLLVAPRKQDAPVSKPCEVEGGATLRLTVVSAARGAVTISNARAFPWTDIEKLGFSAEKVLSANPRVTVASRVSGVMHSGDSTWPAGVLAQFRLVSEAPYDMDFSASLTTPRVGDAGGKVACDGTSLTIPTGRAEEAVATEPCWLAGRSTRTISVVLAKPDAFVFNEAHNRPPAGWIAFRDPAMAGVFWKAETGKDQSMIIPDDDPSKQSVGYEVGVTFFNARTEPAIVNFVVVPSVGTPPQQMPDPQRNIGGGTALLLGGEVKKVVRASIVREWTLWATPRKPKS